MLRFSAGLPIIPVPWQLASAIDLIVHLGRLRDRSRKLLEICEITGIEEGSILTKPLFRFREQGEKDGRITGCWEQTGTLTSVDKLAMAGIHCPWS